MNRQHTMILLLMSAMFLSTACSTGYRGKVAEMHRSLTTGDLQNAVTNANAALGVSANTQQPAKLSGDMPLLLLERAMLLQALGDHKGAVRDLNAADQVLEVLDMTSDDLAEVGKYLFSDDVTLYKAPPHEKLLVNVMGMISYLALGDIDGAKVEARRLSVLQRYYEHANNEERELFSMGSFIAGVVFEMSGDYDESLRYYLEAYQRQPRPSLQAPIAYLSEATGFQNDTINDALKDAPEGVARAPGDDEGLLLVVVQNGLSPFKVAKRFPVGLFFASSVNNQRYAMSAEQRQEANKMVVSGLLKWVNFPVLVEFGSAYRNFSLRVDGQFFGEPQYAIDVRKGVLSAWEGQRTSMMVSAFTRLLARALAAEVAEAGGEKLNLDRSLFPGASWLLGKAVEGGLAANDTPDTRSWTALPSNIQIYRAVVPAGKHTIQVNAFGDGFSPDKSVVEIPPRGFGAVTFRYIRGAVLPEPEVDDEGNVIRSTPKIHSTPNTIDDPLD